MNTADESLAQLSLNVQFVKLTFESPWINTVPLFRALLFMKFVLKRLTFDYDQMYNADAELVALLLMKVTFSIIELTPASIPITP